MSKHPPLRLPSATHLLLSEKQKHGFAVANDMKGEVTILLLALFTAPMGLFQPRQAQHKSKHFFFLLSGKLDGKTGGSYSFCLLGNDSLWHHSKAKKSLKMKLTFGSYIWNIPEMKIRNMKSILLS